MNFATTQISNVDMFGNIDWIAFADALEAGHRLPEAEVEDVFLGRPGEPY